MRRRLTLTLAVACLLLGGCRSTRHTTAPTTPTPATPAVTTTESGTATETPAPKREYTVINFNATVEGISASGQLRMAKDSVMWVSVNKIVELGRAMATPDSLWLTAPLFDKRFAGTYDDLRRQTKRNVSFEQLQAIATSDDAEERMARLAASMGFTATVTITSRRKVDSLKFPFRKDQ